MSMIPTIFILVVAFLQLMFLYNQMVVWQTPKGIKLFKLDVTTAKPFQTLALQQGLYNGFLAIGLLGSAFLGQESVTIYGVPFFLGCIILAGIVGGFTAYRKILYLQALPASIALILFFTI